MKAFVEASRVLSESLFDIMCDSVTISGGRSDRGQFPVIQRRTSGASENEL